MTTSAWRWLIILLVLVNTGVTHPAFAGSDQLDRVLKAATVMDEIIGAPDQAIPDSVLAKAEGIAVFPSTVKAGFIFGGHRVSVSIRCTSRMRRSRIDTS